MDRATPILHSPTDRRPARRARTAPGTAALVLVLAFTPLAPCHADGPWTIAIGATSDYVFRGVSQTYGTPAVQGGVTYQSPLGWYVGAWASRVDPFPFVGSARELDLYGGYGWSIGGDFTARATYTRYRYLSDPRPVGYDYSEFALTLAWLDRLTASLSYQPSTVAYSSRGYASGKPTVAYELSGRLPLRDHVALAAGVGYYDLDRLFGVRYWSGSSGLAYMNGRLEVDLTRFFSDPTVGRLYDEASADGSWVVSAVYRF